MFMVGPKGCPNDIVLMEHTGVKSLPHDTVKILKQDTKTVTVELTQTFSSDTIDGFYYQYQYDDFSTKCYPKTGFSGRDSIEIKIECRVNSPIAILELWVSDSIENGVLSKDDNAVVPQCCHSEEPEGTPSTKYLMVIKCRTECPD